MKNMATKINGKIYETKYTNDYTDICARNMDRTWRYYGFIIIVIFSSIACASFSPIYVFVKYKSRASLFQAKIPYVEAESSLEFGINCAAQAISGIFIILGNIGIEGVLVLFVNSLNVTTDISKFDYDELSTRLLRGKISASAIKVSISKMCQQIQVVDR